MRASRKRRSQRCRTALSIRAIVSDGPDRWMWPAPSLSTQVRYERFAWIRSRVASGSGSALVRVARHVSCSSRRPFDRAASSRRPVAAGSTAAAPAIASVCFTDRSPATAALATSGRPASCWPVSSSRAASARVVPVVRASQSSAERSPSPCHTTDSATLAAAIDFSVRPVRSIRSPSATRSLHTAGGAAARSSAAIASARDSVACSTVRVVVTITCSTVAPRCDRKQALTCSSGWPGQVAHHWAVNTSHSPCRCTKCPVQDLDGRGRSARRRRPG